ncbi:MAG: hypothetical protein WCR55_07805, partial [Lentisphaerota bacterium]
MTKIKKKFSFNEFLPHVLGMILFCNGFLHITISILLALGIDTQFLVLIDSDSLNKNTLRYIGIASGIIIGVWQFFNGIGIYKRHKRAVYSTVLLIFMSSIKYMVFNSFPQMVFIN